jgi:hypothetical protein
MKRCASDAMVPGRQAGPRKGVPPHPSYEGSGARRIANGTTSREAVCARAIATYRQVFATVLQEVRPHVHHAPWATRVSPLFHFSTPYRLILPLTPSTCRGTQVNRFDDAIAEQFGPKEAAGGTLQPQPLWRGIWAEAGRWGWRGAANGASQMILATRPGMHPGGWVAIHASASAPLRVCPRCRRAEQLLKRTKNGT